MNQRVPDIFRKSKLYYAFRHSWLHAIYTRIRYPQYYNHKLAENEFYHRIINKYLSPQPLIFDIGANIGDLTIAFLNAGAHVVAIEPDPANIAHLQFRNRKYSFTLVTSAVGEIKGQIPFYINSQDHALSSAKNSANQLSTKTMVFCQKIDDLIAQFGKPDFIKIDAEGFEWPILNVLSHPIKMICFEINFPEYLKDANHIINHLNVLSNDYKYNYSINDQNLELEDFTGKETMLEILTKYKGRYAMIFCLLDH